VKILHYSEYVSIDQDTSFTRNLTGYGYMVMDIATSTSIKNTSVDLLTYSGITDEKIYNNVRILQKTWFDIFFAIRLKHCLKALSIVLSRKASLNELVKIAYSYISIGLFQKIIFKNEYDIIHIHGISPTNLPIIEFLLEANIKFVVTLHGLNSFSSIVIASDFYKKNEKSFINRAYKSSIPVTVISDGIKKDISYFLGKSILDNFTVIPNGCLTGKVSDLSSVNIRKKYNISKDSKIALCVGNISPRKNQVQVVRAYSKLTTEERDKFVILFIGSLGSGLEMQEMISELGFVDKLILCGSIPKNEMHCYYSSSDFTVLASISEGFGLSIIEGFVYGLPCLTFYDLDAVSYVYNEKSMMVLHDRTDLEFSKGMVSILNKSWDKDFIKKYSCLFSLEEMGKKYINFYRGV
jgi:glycosyltransferase involved in cell wall biosynthesis